MSRYLYSIIIFCLFLAGCDNSVEIYHAEYLDDIPPISDEQQTFIVKSSFLNRPICNEIEKWSRENIERVNHYKVYTFLEYNENITYKNRYLESEYDAIALDYLMCQMNDEDRKCFTCEE